MRRSVFLVIACFLLLGLSQLALSMKEPMYDPKRKFINTKTQYPIEAVAALYNYKFVLEDRGNGVHNMTYAVQILMDSLKALDKNFDDSKRP